MAKYTHVIITDESGKPMAWDEVSKQICYCTDNNWESTPFPVTTYTIKKAARLITKSVRNRKRWKMGETKYKTMPFDYPARKKYIWPNKKL